VATVWAFEHEPSGDGRVIAIHHNTAERNGKELDVDCCLVFEVEDGRITAGSEYFYDLGVPTALPNEHSVLKR